MKAITLVEMKAGQKGTVSQVEGGTNFEKRLATMGLGVGKHITKLSAFVMRGPVAVRIGRTVVALGHGMAARVWVHPEKE